MSKKRDFILRYLYIIKKLRTTQFATFQEINNYLENQFELQDAPIRISIRTFQRDINEIRTIFNIDIQCNNINQYFISEDEHSEFNNRMLEAFDMINTFSFHQELKTFIQLENRCSLGTENLLGIIHAIKNRLKLKITYQPYYIDSNIERNVEPYLLKEFKGRYYLLAKDDTDNKYKSFGLDRIKTIEITHKFTKHPEFNPTDFFKNCFGIFKDDKIPPKEIVLSFEPLKGKYIKAFPLHHSQQILVDNNKEFQVSLFAFEAPDLISELLSYGNKVKVLNPKTLVDLLTDRIKEMRNIYN